MATKAPGPLADWYQARIGSPSTGDEVLGYWIFSLGIILGTLGLVQFFFSPTNSLARMLGYVMGAVGLVALIVGPTIRLPLTRRATLFSYGGAALCLAAIVWFFLVYPETGSARSVTSVSCRCTPPGSRSPPSERCSHRS